MCLGWTRDVQNDTEQRNLKIAMQVRNEKCSCKELSKRV